MVVTRRFKVPDGEYQYINGVEFFARQRKGVPKADVGQIVRFYNTHTANEFPVIVFVRKRKDGYWIFSNDTVHNFNGWKRTGMIPRE